MSYGTSAITNLKEWIQQHTIPSYDFITSSTSWVNAFIPADLVESHFQTPSDNYRRTTSLLHEVFHGVESVPVSAKFISQKCCRVMCVLVLAGRPELITVFVANDALWDDKLPFDPRSPPPDFPEPNDEALYNSFVKNQWRFFAPRMEIITGWGVKQDRIFPFTHGEEISSKGSSTVHKVHVHEKHDKLIERTEDGEPVSHWYALKTFKGRDAERNFQRESAAFMNITGAQSIKRPGMIGFFQSFQYRDTFNILLEYADEYTLEHFFFDKPKPITGWEIIDFWESLLGIIKGICVLHLPQGGGRGASVHGWHQDLKPENILVVSNHNAQGYRWRFKVADLALCHFKTVLERGTNALDLDAFGTRTYAAPECLGESKFTQFEQKFVTNAVDIWSLGCVLAEACVWVVRGAVGLKTFRDVRKQATDAILDFLGGDCFHNGEELLPELESQLNELKRKFHSYDYVTGRVIDRLVLGMLEKDPKVRLTAPQVQGTVEKVIANARSDLAHVMGMSQSSTRRSTNQTASAATGQGSPSQGRVALETSFQPWSGVLETRPVVESPERSETPNESTTDIAAVSNRLAKSQSTADQSALILVPLEGVGRSVVNPNQTNERGRSGTLESAFSEERGSIGTASGGFIPGAPNDSLDSSRPNTRETGNGHRNSANSLKITQSPESDEKIPDLPVGKAFDWFHDKKEEGTIEDPLPDAYLLGYLKGRDQIFIVDDSEAMREHKRGVQSLVRLLAYMTKHYDDDKLELFFLGSDERCESKSSRKLAQAVEGRRFHGTTDLSKRLGEILHKYGREIDQYSRPRSPLKILQKAPKSPKKTSIYVFTDGKLETGDAQQGHEEIKAIVQKLHGAGFLRDQLGIQLISFGKDPEGLQRLKGLDLLKHTANLPFDIVDTEPSTGNVWKMLLGGFKPRFDRDRLSVGSPTSPSPGPSTRS